MLRDITTPNAMNYLITLIVAAAKRIFNNGFKLTQTKQIVEYTNEALESHDTVKIFIKHNLETWNKISQGFIHAQELFNQYRDFCKDENVTFEKTRNNFFIALKSNNNLTKIRSRSFKTPFIDNPTVYIFKGTDMSKISVGSEEREVMRITRKKVGWK